MQRLIAFYFNLPTYKHFYIVLDMAFKKYTTWFMIKISNWQNSHRFIRYRLQHLDQWDKHTVIFDLQI